MDEHEGFTTRGFSVVEPSIADAESRPSPTASACFPDIGALMNSNAGGPPALSGAW